MQLVQAAPKVCANPACSKPFITHDIRKRYCTHTCANHIVRDRRRATHTIDFTGVDGEGMGRGKAHRYVLLGVGEKHISESRGLGWEEIFTFLWECYAGSPGSAYVGFFLGYDFTYWLRGIPEERAKRLFTDEGIRSRLRKRSGGNPVPFPVELTGQDKWEIDALGLKRVKIRPAGEKSWMYVCDVGSYFQTSFLNVINPKSWHEPVCTQEEYDLIVQGKAKRDVAVLDDDMVKYNRLENIILARVMRKMNEGLVRTGVRLPRDKWFGPGQAAQAWLATQSVPKSTVIHTLVPPWAINAARAAYFGGWFEIMMHGIVPGITWEYDINSAYPWVMQNLPCLLHGTWSRGGAGQEPPRGGLLLRHATLTGTDPYIGTAPHRNKEGTISRPHKTGGWYWDHELQAAKRAGMVREIQTRGWVHYAPCGCEPPLSGLASLYSNRLAVGKNTPEGKGNKTVYNSGYGKFAQSVGSPVYANSVYASLITAGCRTKILDAIATHPEGTRAVAMVATDAVYFRTRHPRLKCSDKLGDWEEQARSNMTLFKPGVYWDDKARESIAKGDPAKFKARGVNAAAFSKCLNNIDTVFRGWAESRFRPGDPGDWPAVQFPVEFTMISIGQALQRGRWYQAGQVIPDFVVKQSSDPGLKRTYSGTCWDGDILRSGVHPYMANPDAEFMWDSFPYEKDMGAQGIEMTPDDNTVIGPLATALESD